MDSADILIIGGGVIGLSIGYHLARRGARGVVVLERAGQVGTGSTAKATGGIRHQFSTEINVRLTQLSLPAFERFEEEMGEPVDFVQHGYLFVTTRADRVDVMRSGLRLQQRLGVPSRWVTPAEAALLFPDLRVDDLAGGTFCPLTARRTRTGGPGVPAPLPGPRRPGPHRPGGGRDRGDRRTGPRRPHGVRHIRRSGRRQRAAGPYARDVAAMAGLDMPVHQYRRQVFVMTPISGLHRRAPLTVDLDTEWYLHQDASGALYIGRDR